MLSGLCFMPMHAIADAAKTEEQIFATVEPFYSWVLANRFVSLPSEKERSELAGFLMPDLIHLMKEAEKMEKQCGETTPKGNKSRYFAGALLVGIYEGATEIAYAKLKIDRLSEGVVTLPTALTYISDHLPKGSRYRVYAWNEELELHQINEKWLINNIHFPDDRSLRSTLQDFISEGRQYCVAQ
jgi:hypothetical protein